ncbi:UNVERIFIED_CONTAM: hypothetical protein FKN15_047373 [Acipenser sinensis]
MEERYPTLIAQTFRLQRANEQLDSLQKEEGSGKGEDLSRSFRELQASHAETILELEKTRDMLILQHKINKDYQTELQAVMRNVEADKEESKRKEEQSTRLLELRANRIHTVEEELRIMGDDDPMTFCTYAFYDFETQATPVVRGTQPLYNFTSQYPVSMEEPFLQYLRRASARLEVHQVCGTDFITLAAGQISLSEESRSLSSQHALGGGSRGISCELEVCVESCSGLSAHWPGLLPDAYVVYKLYDLPDHDSPIIPCSADPVFRDQATFHLPMTFDLQRYLRFESLWIYIFDDADSEQTAYLGKASVPLISLSLGKDIRGDFILRDPAGRPSGSIKVCLSWKSPYQPPGTALRQAAETIEQLLEREREPSVGAPPRHTPIAKPRGSERMRVEILSLTFDPQSPVALDEGVQRVYVEYRLLGVPMEMTETPISLRTPREGEEVHYNFTRVIYVDRTVNSALRQYLYTMLEGTDPNQGRLKFTVVSEPMNEQEEECVDVGHAYLDLTEILRTGNDVIEQQIDIVSVGNPDESIGKLKVSLEAAKTLCSIYWEFKNLCKEEEEELD